MTPRERGFLLLSSHLGDPGRKPLTTAQLRILADRSWQLDDSEPDRDLEAGDLTALGYSSKEAERIVALLSQEDVLDHYLSRALKAGCYPVTRVTEGYPLGLRRKLGLDSPGVLWAKGDLSILQMPKISLVGSRELHGENAAFAQEVGRQAAMQGYALVSGNARGADQTAQKACLSAGGKVISVVADRLSDHRERENVLFLSENAFDEEFTSQRALSRNRVIHALGEKTFVAQAGFGMGGTWDGTVKNLRWGWSDVFCFQDGSEVMKQLSEMGASLIGVEDLADLNSLQPEYTSLF